MDMDDCDHDYRFVSVETIRTRAQDTSIDDDDLSRSELIDRMNDDQPHLVKSR
ncbi:hypothetical protein [Pseudomonas sp. LS-2]|uniref:hypothetical protein n=1 Tax=Pseudomonas sp. LS-2 TaxID=2315859 RepID=UPI0014055E0E|nr:hypothetical protein [Pseudomonas sp. LS-2]